MASERPEYLDVAKPVTKEMWSMISSENDKTAEELARRALMVEMVKKRAMEHPLVLEIMADCAAAFDTENHAMHDPEVDGPYDGSRLKDYEAQLRASAKRIRTEDPDIWPQDKFSLEQLARFDDNLNPVDLHRGLIRHKVAPLKATAVVSQMQRQRAFGGRCGAVDLFQEFIDDINITMALENLVLEFVLANKPS